MLGNGTSHGRDGPGRPRSPAARGRPAALSGPSRPRVGTLCGCAVVAGTTAALAGEPVLAGLVTGVLAPKIAVMRALERRTARALATAGAGPAAPTPLTTAVARSCTGAALGLLALATILYVLTPAGGHPVDRAHVAAALALAAVPLELPAATAALLALGTVRMARCNAAVRRFDAVEAVGATTVVCTRTTGVLTRDEFTVTTLVAGGSAYLSTATGASPAGEVRAGGRTVRPGENLALDECVRAGLNCNDARLVEAGGRMSVAGDPADGALVVSAARLGLRTRLHRRGTLPFTADRRYMATVHRIAGTDEEVIYVKGSVERVLYLCESELDHTGRVRALDREAVLRAAGALERRGSRVLAFARAHGGAGPGRPTERDIARLEFLGLQAMHDPPRPDSADAVLTCQDASLPVKLFAADGTDAAATAAAWVGLDGGAAMTGAGLAACDPHGLPRAVARATVFAHLTPAEEALVVRALRHRGQVVTLVERPDRPGTARGADGATPLLVNNGFAAAVAAIGEARTVLGIIAAVISGALAAIILSLAAAVLALAAPSACAEGPHPRLVLSALAVSLAGAACVRPACALAALVRRLRAPEPRLSRGAGPRAPSP